MPDARAIVLTASTGSLPYSEETADWEDTTRVVIRLGEHEIATLTGRALCWHNGDVDIEQTVAGWLAWKLGES